MGLYCCKHCRGFPEVRTAARLATELRLRRKHIGVTTLLTLHGRSCLCFTRGMRRPVRPAPPFSYVREDPHGVRRAQPVTLPSEGFRKQRNALRVAGTVSPAESTGQRPRSVRPRRSWQPKFSLACGRHRKIKFQQISTHVLKFVEIC